MGNVTVVQRIGGVYAQVRIQAIAQAKCSPQARNPNYELSWTRASSFFPRFPIGPVATARYKQRSSGKKPGERGADRGAPV